MRPSAASLIDPRRALAWDNVPASGSLKGDTVYVAAVDREGNAASLIFSLYGVFGACVIAGEPASCCKTAARTSRWIPTHPNRLEPGKMPLHTLIASMAVPTDKLWSRARLHGRRWPAADPAADIRRR